MLLIFYQRTPTTLLSENGVKLIRNIIFLQEFYLPMQSGGILSPENLAAIFLNLQVDTECDRNRR